MPGTAHRYELPKPEIGDFGIIVTTPKANWSRLMAKVDWPDLAFWNFGRTPKRLSEEDLVYVIWNGFIRYAFTIARIARGPLSPVEDADGHNPSIGKNGCRIWFDDVIELLRPIPMKGFQGFRYYNQNEKEE